MYKKALIVPLVCCVATLMCACNNSKSPSTVAKDVNAAAQKADESTAKAEDRAAEKIASAQGDVRNEQRNEGHVAAVQEEGVAETEAKGRRDVALAKCESLSGDSQRACKDQANAAYDAAIAQAKLQRANSDPKR